MRVFFLLMTVCLMQVSASTYAQRISLSEKDASLLRIFQKINKQSGISFLMSNELLAGSKNVNINVKNEELDVVLDKVFKGQPLSYELKDRVVIVSRKEQGFLDNLIARFQAIDVRGRVVDEKGSPLVGASIKVKNGKGGATAGSDGKFVINSVDEGATLVISYIGYVNKEVKIYADLGDISLELSDSKLDEIQVIAYGTTSKRLNTGNIGTLKSKEITNQPVSNPLLAISGRVPGVYISQSSGMQGSGVTVRIQGQNSIFKGSDPFYVIDGVPYTAQLLPTLSNILGGPDFSGNTNQIGQGNPLSLLNPNDIESIDVLKDADATAIYGSRAANGAILITTKKGKSGKTIFDVTMQSGAGKVPNKLKMLTLNQYLEMRKEAYTNDGLDVPSQSDPDDTKNVLNYDLTLYDQNRFTDWQNELIGGTAGYQDVQASVSGGSELTNFRLNGGFHRETTVFPGSFSDLKGSLGVNLSHNSIDNKFNLRFSANYLKDKNQLPTHDLTYEALSLPPNAPALYASNGELNWQRVTLGSDSISTWDNPLAYLENTYQVDANNLMSNVNLSYQFNHSLVFRTSLGYTDLTTKEILTSPLSVYKPEDRAFIPRSASYANGRINSWIVEPQLSYNFFINKGRADFLIGGTLQGNSRDLGKISGEGYSSDAVLKNYSSASKLTSAPSLLTEYKYNALFGRFNYNWLDKYILNFTVRRDGSSRFGNENRFHNFGAVGAAWIFSKESFIEEHIRFLSFGKIRGSYGTAGNDQIGEYGYLNQYTPITISVPNPYQGIVGLQPSSHPNPYLQWELTKKLQAGLDLGVLSDRILLGVNYFDNRSSNQLLNYSLPYQSGFAGVIRNFPATVQNKGWEFSLTTENIKHKNFTWTSNLNATAAKNKLLTFPNISSSSYANTLIVGESLSTSKLLDFAGVDAQTGLFQYRAADGSLTSSPNDITDRTILKDQSPTIYGGLQNNFSYKGFELSFFSQFVKKNAANYKLGTTFYLGGLPWNEPEGVLKRWQNPGDQTNIQKFSTANSLFTVGSSTLVNGDASFVRLKNVALSWNLPESFVKKAKMQRCRVFVQGQNVFTITNYIGLDPENATENNLPPLRVITYGIQLTL